MKLRFYCDVYLPLTGNGLFAQTNPGAKIHGSGKRFAFDVTIPDDVLYGVDFISPEVGKVESVAEDDAP